MSRMELDYRLLDNGVLMADNAYILTLRLSLGRYRAELSEIRSILTQRALSNLEYRALTEACIGVAKHWAKGLAGHNKRLRSWLSEVPNLSRD